MKNLRNTLISILMLSNIAGADSETPNIEEMWKVIQQQQETIRILQAKLESNEEKVKQQTAAVEEQTQVVELQSEVLEIISDNLDQATNDSNSKFKFGGYGELHYGNTDNGNEIDFHRFVMFNSYEFDERTRLFTELELEHSLSGDGKPGEVELEQAYIEHMFNDTTKMKAGLMLMPIGILNETHEPDTFYGVERNNVENKIIPTTWWEAGFAISQEVNENFGYDVFVSSGLNVPTSGSNAFLIRSGRQKVAEAVANDGAITARAKWNPMNNLKLAASYQYQQDITQGAMDIGANLFEINATYQYNSFGLKALYAHWVLDDKAGLIAAGREEQKGYFIEPSYKFGENNQYGVFTRYSAWDNNAGEDNLDTLIKQIDIGFNYWLTPRVVFKADYQDQSGAASDDGLHLGVGYSF